MLHFLLWNGKCAHRHDRCKIALEMTCTGGYAESLIRTQITLQYSRTECEWKVSRDRVQTIHVCKHIHKTRFHIQLDYYLWIFSERGYDLVVVCVCMFMAIQNVRIHKFHARHVFLLFSHKFSATSKIVPFSVIHFGFFFLLFHLCVWMDEHSGARPRYSENCICNLFGETKWWIYLCDNNVGNKIIGLCALSELTLNEAIKHQ